MLGDEIGNELKQYIVLHYRPEGTKFFDEELDKTTEMSVAGLSSI